MLFGLLRGGPKGAPRRAARPEARPQVEGLEERLLQATRPLAGLLANSLPNEDDTPSAQANLGFTVNFFGVQTGSVFVNNNGNVTIGTDFPTYTPSSLNTDNGGIPIIAPFFADVDTTVGNVVTYGTDTLCGRHVFGVNWFNVGYFNSHVDKLNTFQLVLIDRSDTGAGNFDIEFNYDKIQWETGDINGTNGFGGGSASAHAGYTNGTGAPGTFFELPGSGVPGSFLDGGPLGLAQHLLLASTPGRYHFEVRNGLVVSVVTSGVEDVTDRVKVFHPFRYLFNRFNDTYRGNLTLLPAGLLNDTAAVDRCLDIPTNAIGLSGLQPLTVVYTSLPAGVTLVNATGRTASGKPYITTPRPVLFAARQVLRIPVVFKDATAAAISTFYEGPQTRVFLGAFNPASE